MNHEEDDEDDDEGLPDAAFTEEELAAGVQHLLRGTRPRPPGARFSRPHAVQETGVPRNGWSEGRPKSQAYNEFTSLDFFFDEIEYRFVGNLDVEKLRTLLAFANEAQITSLHKVIQRFAAPKQTIVGDWPYAWSQKRFPEMDRLLFMAYRDLDLKTMAEEIQAALAQFAGGCR